MNIFITGASGFVGGEVLVELSKKEQIEKIFCLVRAKNQEEGILRIKRVFNFHKDFFDEKIIIPIVGNLLDESLLEDLKNNAQLNCVDTIIHSAANTSFSRMHDDLVERVNSGGLLKIIEWSKTLPNLKTFVYIGTATICGCGDNVKNKLLFETDSPNLSAQHFVKYTDTKLRGELLIHAHLPENKVLILRPSIIMGDSRMWLPRSYVILWALATCNLIRLLPLQPNREVDVVSIDFVAQAIVALLFAKRKYNVYHISSGHVSKSSILKCAKVLGPCFPDKPDFKFIDPALISQMKNWAKNRLQLGSELYLYPEYLKYWESIFEDKGKLRILFAGLEPYIEFMQLGQVFDNTRLLEDTGMAPCKPVHEYILSSIPFLEKIDVYGGALDP
ncbi:MAG: SDR family oxidoreductase [bacterium]